MLSTTSPSTPSSQSHHTFSWFLLIVANVLWAASYVAARFALRDFSVLFIILPLLGTLLAIVLLDDQLSPMTIVDGVLIVISVYLISRR